MGVPKERIGSKGVEFMKGVQGSKEGHSVSLRPTATRMENVSDGPIQGKKGEEIRDGKKRTEKEEGLTEIMLHKGMPKVRQQRTKRR